MPRFGSDKPDLCYGLTLTEVSDLFAKSSFAPFVSTIADGGVVKAISLTGSATKISGTRLKKVDVYQQALRSGAKALTGTLSVEQQKEPAAHCQASPGDVILFAAGFPPAVNRTLDAMWTYLAENLRLINKAAHEILWVTDFPMFEWNDDEQRLKALHHPFMAPHPQDIDDLKTAQALAYYLVYNGVEVFVGFRLVVEVSGYTDEKSKKKCSMPLVSKKASEYP
ncbi:unnamed protein product [Sphagnum balticum]